ncbi:hypothetical protein JQ559_12745 [Bradyrhizobium viridifuturi]|jgi:hypothetical protein|uniref:hypothetical protein n=1 Tax=Bradyrhizobium TaxID=374 RepID=UPI000BD2B35F|nr:MULTISPECIES: hypothetical protein [Bradyrhizobium]OYU59702.1 MAG: hypothetical protein CFE30_24470 [Bradyrhizobium sp. PARBB1]PSO24993.1 hypothetical protein C7G43_18155 [Bradyrhizobium sp. MOS004]QRI67061.1 hypothetical protein JQ507_18815 [Bradyrhizobium sp. PSBB068]MBR1019707.1 hypothetical protein [Bradyrhizobium viridifuturi]MBR1037327.1 hypothetical protein [Bradyrhizobium viridifuturi]
MQANRGRPETTAGELLRIYSIRLRMNDEGLTKWTPALRASVESLAEKLESLDPAEAVEIEADIDNDPIGRFIRVATGECLAEIRR